MVCTYEAKRSVEIPLIVAQGDGFFGIDAVRMHVGDKRSRILPSAVLFRDDPVFLKKKKKRKEKKLKNTVSVFEKLDNIKLERFFANEIIEMENSLRPFLSLQVLRSSSNREER